MSDDIAPLSVATHLSALVAAASEDAEEEDEEVDEVEIEIHRADCSQFVGHGGIKVRLRHTADLLGVPRGQSDEKDYTYDGYYPFNRTAVGKDVDNHQNDKSEESHHKVAAHLREVRLGEITIDRHCSECACSDEKGIDDSA